MTTRLHWRLGLLVCGLLLGLAAFQRPAVVSAQAAPSQNGTIVGAITNYCCENTARDACQMDFKVFFITDATAAMTDAEHNASLGSVGGHADLRTTAEMLELLQGPQPQ